ncbi:MAG: HAD-IA family hydrolase [Anaerolineales bacterium]|nr:HAD-IA family hydrolase [Anaerolineales bacterium]
MSEDRRIQAVIWDLGGVILRTEDLTHRERWEARLGFEAWELASLVFHSDMSHKASLGHASVDDIWISVQTSLRLSDSERDALRADFFAGDEVDDILMDFIREIHPQYKSGMITNAWPDLRSKIEDEIRIADAFDKIVISSEVGIVKPDPRIYEIILNDFGIAPAQAVFVDDFMENVEGAHAVGMHALHFRNTSDAILDLKTLLHWDE